MSAARVALPRAQDLALAQAMVRECEQPERLGTPEPLLACLHACLNVRILKVGKQ